MGACGPLDGLDFGGLLGGFEVDLVLEVDLGTLELDIGELPELDIDPETWGLDLKTLDPPHEGR